MSKQGVDVQNLNSGVKNGAVNGPARDSDDLREETISRTRIYDGRILSLRVDEVRLPGGKTASREVVEHKGAVALIPVTDSGEIVLVRQYRYPAGTALWEIPAGKLEAGEEPKVAAQRELAEETGYRAQSLRKVGEFFTTPGFSSELMHLYLAEGLNDSRAEADPDEVIQTRKLTLEEVAAWLDRGEIKDAKTLVGLNWFLRERGVPR